MEDITIKAEPQEPVIFEDEAVYFTEQELASLTLDQKALHEEVVLENFAHVALLGCYDMFEEMGLGAGEIT
ncbi:mCG17373, isoform CRA_a [Mus musculus]|nr:mCG17373, isoform CRA_a [Mus musculus]